MMRNLWVLFITTCLFLFIYAHAAEIKLGGNWWVVEDRYEGDYTVIYATEPFKTSWFIVDSYPSANIAEDVAEMLNVAHQRRMDEREGQQ